MGLINIDNIQNDANGSQLRDAFRVVNEFFGEEVVDVSTIVNTQWKYNERNASGLQLRKAFQKVNEAFEADVVNIGSIQNVCNGIQLKNAFTLINAYMSGYSPPVDPADRTVLCLNDTDSQIDIDYAPQAGVTTSIACLFALGSLPPEGEFAAIWGVDSNLHMSVNNDLGNNLIRMSLFGIGGNKPVLGIVPVDEWLVCGLSWPGYNAEGTARLNNKPVLVSKGSSELKDKPLRFGWRDGGGFVRCVQALGSIMIWENGLLVHHYPLDSDTGAVAEDIVGGLDGTITSPNWCQNPLYVAP